MPDSELATDRQRLLRQIAVVVDSLQRSDADALLERLPGEQESAVRNQMIELEFEAADAEEREFAAQAFYHHLLADLGLTRSNPGGAVGELETESSRSMASLVAGFAGGVAAGAASFASPSIGRDNVADAVQDDTESNSLPESFEHDIVTGGGVESVESLRLYAGDVNVFDGNESAESAPVEHPLPAASLPAADTVANSERMSISIEHVPPSLLPLRDVVESQSLDSLAGVLKHEQPQTVALVMAAMLPEEAAEFISAWPQAEQGEVLRRIAKMQNTDSLVVDTVRDELLRQLDRFADEAARGEEGRERVQAIVAASQGSAKQDLLGGLADADRELFRQVAEAAGNVDDSVGQVGRVGSTAKDGFDPHLAAVAFDRFVDLSDSGLRRVFAELDPDVSVLALAGASQPCLSDVLERLPASASRDLRARMEHLGPLRLGDIQRAQLMAVAASHHLLSGKETVGESIPRLKLTA